MRTLDLTEAAAFLGIHPNTLQARAKSGAIPGAKDRACLAALGFPVDCGVNCGFICRFCGCGHLPQRFEYVAPAVAVVVNFE